MQENEVIIYQPDESTHLEIYMRNENVWLNRQQLSILFDRDIKTIGKHIKNALSEELVGHSVVAKFATTATDGKIYQVEHYNLDLILSVGYRVKSDKGIRFRIWANQILKDYLLKGYAVNEKLLKEKNAELTSQLQTLSLLVINDIPLTKEMIMDIIISRQS